MGIVSGIATFIIRVFEGCLSATKIKDFVLKKYMVLKRAHEENKEFDDQLIELEMNLAVLGWIDLDESKAAKNKNSKEADRSRAIQWFKDLKDSKIIDQGIITEATGANLDWLDDNSEDLDGFNAMALESVLRIVEIKRKKIFNAFSRDLTHDEKIREGLGISILLSRTSRRHKDLRYLNAAFKMNDWYYPIFRSPSSEKSLIQFLLALTEQERSAAELLQ